MRIIGKKSQKDYNNVQVLFKIKSIILLLNFFKKSIHFIAKKKSCTLIIGKIIQLNNVAFVVVVLISLK